MKELNNDSDIYNEGFFFYFSIQIYFVFGDRALGEKGYFGFLQKQLQKKVSIFSLYFGIAQKTHCAREMIISC